MSEQDYHSKAGLARTKNNTPEKLSEIGKQGALARWTIKAIRKGNLQNELGIDVDFHVLDDTYKTVVINQKGMGKCLGLGEIGSRLPEFISGERISPYIGRELSSKLENPIIFQGLGQGVNERTRTMYGYSIEYLIDLCRAIIKAEYEGKLLDRQDRIYRQASNILSASAKLGIKHLAYALCGYDPIREATIADFRRFVREDAGDYEKLFPHELYEHWARIYQLSIHKCSNGFELRPWKFKYLTEDHIYWPVAKTKGAIQHYITERRKQTQGFGKRLFQWLNENGRAELRDHMNRLVGMMDSVEDGDIKEYEKRIEHRFGKPPKE